LLVRHQERLRQLIALRMDRRLAARLDPSDVVQETLAEAIQRLSDYLRRGSLPFYPWLRQLALDRLTELHRRHIQTRKRSVMQEEPPALPDESVLDLAQRLLTRGSSPSARLLRAEQRDRVQAALARLADTAPRSGDRGRAGNQRRGRLHAAFAGAGTLAPSARR
jgi:RNA polymerase sigma-70 factor, ECF subfamily